MNIETVIFSYIFICGGLMLFSIFLFPFYGIQENLRNRRTRAFEASVLRQIEALGESSARHVSGIYQLHLYHRLRRQAYLMAYAIALNALKQKNPNETQLYLKEIFPVFSRLCSHYEKRPLPILTYFTYLLGNLFRDAEDVPERVYAFLFMRLRSESLYCRQNALAALYGYRNPEKVVKAVLLLNRLFPDYNDKLITDGMARYTADKYQLADQLLAVYQELHDDYKLSVLNFLRLCDGRHGARMLALLEDTSANDELRYAAIRYLGKYRFQEAKPILLDMVQKSGRDSWPYGAVSATALAGYPGEDTFAVLKAALHSPDWYVRLNASASLELMGIDYQRLSDVLNGNDRYAREIVQYRLDLARQRKGGGQAK